MAKEVAEALGEAVAKAPQGDDSDEHEAAGAAETNYGSEPMLVSASKGFAGETREGKVVSVASADDPQGLKMAGAAARQAGLTTKEERREFHNALIRKCITKFMRFSRYCKIN